MSRYQDRSPSIGMHIRRHHSMISSTSRPGIRRSPTHVLGHKTCVESYRAESIAYCMPLHQLWKGPKISRQSGTPDIFLALRSM